MTTVSPLARARHPLVFVFSSFTKQIDQIARPSSSRRRRRRRSSRGTYCNGGDGGDGGGDHSALSAPAPTVHTARIYVCVHIQCLLGYRTGSIPKNIFAFIDRIVRARVRKYTITLRAISNDRTTPASAVTGRVYSRERSNFHFFFIFIFLNNNLIF